jgi:hypothetical protein
MRRLLATGLLAGLALAVTGCGSSTATVNLSLNGQPFMSMVASGDQKGIDDAKAKAQQQSTGQAGVAVSVVDGDQHQGNKVCETDVTDSSGTYHVVVYSSNPLVTQEVCTSIAQGAASASSST